MSKDDVQTVRRVYDAWSRGVPADATDALDPAVVWEAIESAPDAGTYRGLSGVKRYMEDWLDGFEILGLDFVEVIDAREQLVIVQQGHTRERRTGLETALDYAVVYTIRDGKIIAVKEFATR